MIFRQKKFIGLDIDEGFQTATELIKKGNQLIITRFKSAANLEDLVNGQILKKGDGVFINIPTQVVLFRSFHLPGVLARSKNKQRDIVAFLTRQNLPFKLDECFWDIFIWGSNLNFIAAKKEMAEKYISQVEGLGLRCLGVVPSLTALYNVLIYNYPEREKDNFSILNIKNTASDLLIYETKRLWIYPLSIGRKDLTEDPAAQMRFSQEVQRIYNAHYMQHPLEGQKPLHYFYISGQGCSEETVSAFKKVFTDFEIALFNPLKKIKPQDNLVADSESIALSTGLAISGLSFKTTLKINLIKERIVKQRGIYRIDFTKRASLFLLNLAIFIFLVMDVILFIDLNRQETIHQETASHISSLLPQVKILKSEKERLLNLESYFKGRLKQQGLYLKALAKIAECKTPSIEIKEFVAEGKDAGLVVFVSGVAPNYEDVNNFLANLKKNNDIKEPKVVASTFPTSDTQIKAIDFKLRLEIL